VITIISFSKSDYNSLLPLNYKTCNKKIKFFRIFLFILPDSGETGKIDEICELIGIKIARNLRRLLPTRRYRFSP
jgi:hypothetical protein